MMLMLLVVIFSYSLFALLYGCPFRLHTTTPRSNMTTLAALLLLGAFANSSHALAPISSASDLDLLTLVAPLALSDVQVAGGKIDNALAATAARSTPRVGDVLTRTEREIINDVFRGRRSRSTFEALSPERRQAAIDFYRQVAPTTGGANPEAARLFNLERARYLEQGGPVPPGSLPEFIRRHGL